MGNWYTGKSFSKGLSSADKDLNAFKELFQKSLSQSFDSFLGQFIEEIKLANSYLMN